MAAKKYTLAVMASTETTRLQVEAAAAVMVFGLAQRTANTFGKENTPVRATVIGLEDTIMMIVTAGGGGAPTVGITVVQTTFPLNGVMFIMVDQRQSQPRATATTASTHHPATAA